MYAVALLIPVVWLALLTAPCLGGNIVDVMKRLTEAIKSPLHIVWCKDSIKCILVFLTQGDGSSVFVFAAGRS